MGSVAMDTADYDIVEVAGLGRPFQLGMAYDLRKHKLLPGLTLWDHETLQNKIGVTDQHHTKFGLETSDSSEDMESSWKINGDLKVAAIYGLVDVGGACTYFKDEKKSEKQAWLRLSYHATTKFKQLSMDHLTNQSYLNELKGTGATHVVVAILYGADAYFVFKRDLDSHENKKEIEGELKLAIQNLSVIKTGGAGLEVSGQKKDVSESRFEKIGCTFHGDFKLHSNPCTLQDALELYKQLPDMIGEKGELGVPLQVWLFPLCRVPNSGLDQEFCTVRNISDSLYTRLAHAMHGLNTTEGKLDDLMKDEAAKSFASFRRRLQDLKQNLRQHKADLVTNVARLLPLVRGHEKEESDLTDLLQAHEGSLFNGAVMERWIKSRQVESVVLGSTLKQLREMKVDLDKDLHALLMDAETETVVSFAYTSLDWPGTFPSDLGDKATSENQTWVTGDVMMSMRKSLSLLKDLKRSNNSRGTKFIASSTGNRSAGSGQEVLPGACIMVYKGGSDEPVRFTPPAKPVFSVTVDRNQHNVAVKLNPACQATEKRVLEYRPKTSTAWTALSVQQDELTLTELESHEYEFRCTAVGSQEDLPVTSDIITVELSKLQAKQIDKKFKNVFDVPFIRPHTPHGFTHTLFTDAQRELARQARQQCFSLHVQSRERSDTQ